LETITSLCEKYSSTFIQKLVICAKVKTKPQGYYKESTPFCRKTIINHCRVKQITENILELNLIKNYLYLVFCSIKIFSNLKGSSSKQLLIPNHVIILIILVTRDNSQCWLLFVHVHRLFMFPSYSQRPMVQL
jgi:hypothetical protein